MFVLSILALGSGCGSAGETPDLSMCPTPQAITNDSRCPTHSYDVSGEAPCPAVGLTCGYPGEGDSTGTSGCFGVATLKCGYALNTDAGGGTAIWIVTR
jgi:hypothetical protein